MNPNAPEPVERICPVCGSEDACMAFDELGYCPADIDRCGKDGRPPERIFDALRRIWNQAKEIP
jgi:hypothetical protein